MCNIFAGQDPATYAYKTRSVRLAGYPTSICLEVQFWDILDEIAARQDMTTPRFLAKLYDEALEINGQVSNFASLLRNACVIYLKHPDSVLAAPNVPDGDLAEPVA